MKHSQPSTTDAITEESPVANSPPAIPPEADDRAGSVDEPCTSSALQKLNTRTTAILVSLDNLEAYLCKMGLVLDSILLLRLLLHKLSWDLSLVVKKRAAVDSACGPLGHKSINDPRGAPSHKLSSTSLGGPRGGFGKSKSFDRRDVDKQKQFGDKNFLRVDYGSKPGVSKRVTIRRSSSVEILRPKRMSGGSKDMRGSKERRKR